MIVWYLFRNSSYIRGIKVVVIVEERDIESSGFISFGYGGIEQLIVRRKVLHTEPRSKLPEVKRSVELFKRFCFPISI